MEDLTSKFNTAEQTKISEALGLLTEAARKLDQK
jgi:hypothetical protein